MGCRVVAHGFASNAASNKASASNGVASNNDLVKANGKAVEEVGRGVADKADVPEVAVRANAHAKQRWSREAYNAYQREYMRKRRLKVLDAVGVDQVELGLCRT